MPESLPTLDLYNVIFPQGKTSRTREDPGKLAVAMWNIFSDFGYTIFLGIDYTQLFYHVCKN
jgi:hypothetical protein